MILTDVNVLVYAHRQDAPDHRAYLAWLDGVVNGDEAYGLSELVLSGFLRVATHPRVFDPPSPLDDALAFVAKLRESDRCVVLQPSTRHFEIFERLCRSAEARGNLVADAYLAALAIDTGCEWITTDRDFSRFPGLRWRHPLRT